MWFDVGGTEDADVFTSAEHVYSYAMELPVGAPEVWEGLCGRRPLHWCRALRGTYTSEAPHRVGTTREVRVAGLLMLRERFFQWDDVAFHHSFVVEETNLPLFRVFAEDYRVAPNGSGCHFRWTFAMTFRNRALAASAPLNRRLLIDPMISDTTKYFGGRLISADGSN